MPFITAAVVKDCKLPCNVQSEMTLQSLCIRTKL